MAAPSSTLQTKTSYFHAESKSHLRDSYDQVFSSGHRGGHIVRNQDIFADELPWLSDPAELDAWILDNPGIIKKYTLFPLTYVTGMNYETYYIKDAALGNKWMRPLIMPELVAHPITNAGANAYRCYLHQQTASSSDIYVSGTENSWWFDPFQAVIRFAPGYTPRQAVWTDMMAADPETAPKITLGTPKFTGYVYIGKTLDTYLAEIKPESFKYVSPSPSIEHIITHNLNTFDLSVDVLVQDPIDLIWRRENVGLKYNSENTLTIYLTLSCNIRVNIEKLK